MGCFWCTTFWTFGFQDPPPPSGELWGRLAAEAPGIFLFLQPHAPPGSSVKGLRTVCLAITSQMCCVTGRGRAGPFVVWAFRVHFGRVASAPGPGIRLATSPTNLPRYSPVQVHGTPRDALEGKAPQRRPQQRLGRRLEEIAKAVGGRLLSVTNAIEASAWRQWLGIGRAPWRRGGGPPPPF